MGCGKRATSKPLVSFGIADQQFDLLAICYTDYRLYIKTNWYIETSNHTMFIFRLAFCRCGRRKGRARLADFGLMRSSIQDATALTLSGAVLGTPAYLSPEQIEGKGEIDIRSDFYALGCVLFFCLTGRNPYEGSQIQLITQHLEAPPPNPQDFNESAHCFHCCE